MIASPKQIMNTNKEKAKFQETVMESPIVAQQHLIHKDSIISSPVTLLPNSVIMEGPFTASSKPINVEAENHKDELYSVPISYGTTQANDTTFSKVHVKACK